MNANCIACNGTGKVFVSYEDVAGVECIKCDGTGKIMNADDTIVKSALAKQENPIQLVTTKPDIELAEELKAELMEKLKPVLETATKALRLGFQVQLNMGANPFKEVVINQLQLLKVF